MKQSVEYTTSHAVYYVSGCLYSGSLSAPTRKKLLVKMREFCNEHKADAEVITFTPIKKIVEITEVKGKFVVLGKITNTFLHGGKYLKQYHTEMNA